MAFDRERFELYFGVTQKDCPILTLQEISLQEKGSIISGPFGSNISSKFFVKDGIPVIRGNNLSLDMDKFIDKGFVYVTQEKADSLNTYAKVNDLIFTAAGTIGQVGIITDKCKYDRYVISNKQLRARVDESIVNPLYAYYWYANPKMSKYIKLLNTGSTIPLINLGILKNLPIPVPPMEIQNKIVSILLSIDEKIELNSKLNQNLEEQISILFNKYSDSAENEVTLSECCTLTSSKRVFAKDYVQEGVPFYRGKEITLKRNGQQITDILYISEEHYEEIRNKYGVPKLGDILITAVGTLGNSYMVQEEQFYFKDGNIIWLKDFRNKEENYYIYDYMQSRVFSNAIDSIRIGSTQAALTIVSLGKLKLVIPNERALKEYYNVSKAIHCKINANINETGKLSFLRDILLPKLMSGAIDLSEI